MLEHFRRRHASARANHNIRQLTPSLTEDSSASEDLDKSLLAEEVGDGLVTDEGGTDSLCAGLRAKLARLEEERKRLDEELEAVRKVIEVCERQK